MKTLVLGMWAFGIPIIQHLAKNNKNQQFFAYEKNEDSLSYMIEHRKNQYFFPEVNFEDNIILVSSLEEILPTVDLIILVIPNQFIRSSIASMKLFLKPWVCFLNLSKGIDNSTLKTVSDTISLELQGFDYQYAVLSGGMIAQELMDEKMLGAEIGTTSIELGKKIQALFQNKNLKIALTLEYKNIELYGALKNIIALYTGYLEWKGYWYSTVGFYICELLIEVKFLLPLLWGSSNIDFTQYALGWDIIATCFGNSRNRYLGSLVWSGSSVSAALEKLMLEKKTAEWYHTLKGIEKTIKARENFPILNEIIQIFSV